MKLNFFSIGLILQMMTFTASTCNKLHAQCSGGMLSASDTNLCVNQETTLILTEYEGSIAWNWRTVGESVWSPISGKIGDTINISITGTIDREVRAFVSGSGCSEPSNIITLHCSEFAEEPIVWDATTTCSNMISNLYADPTVKTSYWKQINGPGKSTFYKDSTENSPDSVVVDMAGQYVFGWHITDGICTKQAYDTVIFYEQNTANAGEDIFHCLVNIGETFNLNAIPSNSNTTGSWSGPGITILEPNNPNTPVRGNPSSSAYTLTWTEYNGSCTDKDIIEVNILREPKANAGTDEQKCSLIDTLNSTPSAEFFGHWTLLSGPDVVSYNSANNYNAIVTASDYGENYVFGWTLTNSFCADTDTVIIDFYEQPIANPVIPENECGRHAVLTAFKSTSSGTTSRYWEYVDGSGPQDLESFLAEDNTAQISIADNAFGNYIFRWKEINAVCADSQDVGLTFYEIPEPDAGEDIDSCGVEARLSAATSIPGSKFNWKILSNPGTLAFIGDTTTNAVIRTTAYGTYPLVLEEENATCSERDTLYVTFTEPPKANAGTGGDTCGYSYTLSALPSIDNSSTQWSLISKNGTFELSMEPTFVATVDTIGKYSYLWSETNLNCSSEDTVHVQYHEPPSARIFSAEDACGTTQQIYAHINQGAANTWSVISGPDANAAARFSDQKADGSFDVVVSSTGEYSFNWNTSTAYCSADTMLSMAFFNDVNAFAGNDTMVCGNNILLRAQPSAYPGFWSQGGKPIVFQNDSTAITTASVDSYGIYNFIWTVINGACMDTDIVEIDFIRPPVASAGSNDTICTETYILSASPETGFWTLYNPDVIKISDVTNANANIQVTQNGKYSLLWTATAKSCSDTALIKLTFGAISDVNAGPNQELDNVFTTEMQAGLLENGLSGEWALTNGSGDPMDKSSPTTGVRNLELGKNTFTWTVNNKLCSSTDSVSIFVYDIFIPEVITPNGDRQNDVFYIRGIEKVGPVEVSIINRWGLEVFYSNDYKNDWAGTNKQGELLTNDTYFYVINIPGTGIRKGFIILKK